MEASERRDIHTLKQHIRSCPTVPSDSFASHIVLHRLEQKLQQGNKIKTHGKKPKRSKLDSFLSTLRLFIIYLPLTLLFLSAVTSHLVYKYYVNYITPMIEAANWIDNDRLDHEFTYYNRQCDLSDITTKSIDDVVLDENIHNVDDAVDNFMVHGMSLFQNIIDEKVSNDLRTYIRRRNHELTNDEIIPLDTPTGRHSFGIDANEDPSVALALNQIGSNNLLRDTLEKLLGPDPAVAEITAITVEPGARAQGWHPDVKPLGNSLKYGQTFTHSYSLFIPLQNVTKRMGATELCPGTHFCGSVELDRVCTAGGFQASESNIPEKAWKAGDGLMMNQKMWHRGGAYRKSKTEANPDRVVFILTFISRPKFGKDHRQLSHGTYFHIHPFMYGHTFSDLKNAQVSMTFPFSMLRSLGIWKPAGANWGYDWVTSSSLRISNSENGYAFEDLVNFVNYHEIAKKVPSFLHGVVDEEGGWKEYIGETIYRLRNFFVVVYSFCVFFYLVFIGCLDIIGGGKYRLFASSIYRLCLINTVIVYFAHQAVHKVKDTQFCKSVDSSTIFARPFLPATRNMKRATTMIVEHAEPKRLTTAPMRSDVLFGNRYDSKYIGSYVNFLDYHPGNRELKQNIDLYTDLYNSYYGLPSIFQAEVSREVESSFDRALIQNDYGEWTVMTGTEKRNQIMRKLTIGLTGLVPTLDKEIAILIANTRFGTVIRMSHVMKRESLVYLQHLKDTIIGRGFGTIASQYNKNVTSSTSKSNQATFLSSSLFELTQSANIKQNKSSHETNTHSKTYTDVQTKKYNYMVGDRILIDYQGSGYFIDCTILRLEYKNYAVAERLFDGIVERFNVYLGKAIPFVPLVEGDKVALIDRQCHSCPNSFVSGTIRNVYPSLEYDVEYEKDDFDYRITDDYLAREI